MLLWQVVAVYRSVRIWEPIDGKETHVDFILLCDGVEIVKPSSKSR
jgi:hypothetical protein